MKLNQNDLEHLLDMIKLGKMTTDQANVEKVRMIRVELVTSIIPSNIRKVLNAAVKNGELGHMKKEGKKPEVYFHPSFEYLAIGERANHERETFNALLAVCR